MLYAPLDPQCRDVQKKVKTLTEDPMTEAYGAPVDEILEAWEKNHRRSCKRCSEYGAANIEVLVP